MLILSPYVTAASSQGKSAVCYAADILEVPSCEKLMFVEAVSHVIMYSYSETQETMQTIDIYWTYVLQKITFNFFTDWMNL